MIVRIWHGRTRAADAEAYTRYMHETGVEAHRGTPGNLGSMILSRIEGEEAHFLVVSLWESLAAIRRFAGDDPEVAVYFPEDERYLLELEPGVQHYEVGEIDLDAALMAAAGPAGDRAKRRP